MAHPGGRPTKLNSELIEFASTYIDSYAGLGEVIPSVEGLAGFINISRSTVYKWRDENEEFSDIVDKILQKQATVLLTKGLKGEFNPTITKLVLSGKHGYVEKQELDQNNTGEMTVNIVNYSETSKEAK